jgi:hypothetical protein
MHCHDWNHSNRSYGRPCGGSSYGSSGTPEIIVLDFSPITNITTITQIANALSIGGGLAAGSNVLVISQ